MAVIKPADGAEEVVKSEIVARCGRATARDRDGRGGGYGTPMDRDRTGAGRFARRKDQPGGGAQICTNTAAMYELHDRHEAALRDRAVRGQGMFLSLRVPTGRQWPTRPG